MRLYLAGPIRGIPDSNHAEFHSAAHTLRKMGHEVFNPVEWEDRDPEGTIDLRACFLRDTAWICVEAEGVVLLPGWGKSKGAKAEKALAEAIGLRVLYIFSPDVGDRWEIVE